MCNNLHIHNKLKVSKLIHGLGIVTIAELLLCGSGQVIKFGPITARMLLFVLCIFVYCIYIVKYSPKFSRTDITLFCLLTIWFLCSASIGLISNAPNEMIIEDMKPVSYFFILPFLILTINSPKVVTIINKLCRNIPLLMAIVYIVYLIVMKTLGIVAFEETYELASSESDIRFRGESGEVFYKGFIYLPIGLIFWIKEKKPLNCILIVTAIFYTLTRGFYVISLLGVFLYILYKAPNDKIRILILFWSLIGVLTIISLMTQVDLGDRTEGDKLRITTLRQVGNAVNGFSFWFGHGFGNGVPIRPLHMENSYLHIFHKSGLLGILIWLYLLFCVIRNYLMSSDKDITVIYLIGTIMIYVQSLFNPYITNSMGIGFVLISYCVTGYYAKNRKNSNLLRTI